MKSIVKKIFCLTILFFLLILVNTNEVEAKAKELITDTSYYSYYVHQVRSFTFITNSDFVSIKNSNDSVIEYKYDKIYLDIKGLKPGKTTITVKFEEVTFKVHLTIMKFKQKIEMVQSLSDNKYLLKITNKNGGYPLIEVGYKVVLRDKNNKFLGWDHIRIYNMKIGFTSYIPYFNYDLEGIDPDKTEFHIVRVVADDDANAGMTSYVDKIKITDYNKGVVTKKKNVIKFKLGISKKDLKKINKSGYFVGEYYVMWYDDDGNLVDISLKSIDILDINEILEEESVVPDIATNYKIIVIASGPKGEENNKNK